MLFGNKEGVKMKIFGLFTCFNRLEKTRKCIESLRKNRGIDWQFIVADDASTDGTAEYLNTQKDIEVIKCDGNAYYSGGMRVAIERAKMLMNKMSVDYVLLFNNDLEFYPEIVNKMIESCCEASKDGNAIIVGSTVDSDGNYSYGGIVRKSNFLPKYKHVMDSGKLLACDTFNGNCVLIPGCVFKKLDGMDSHYCHALGDYDFGFSATRKGFKSYASNYYVGVCEHDHYKKDTWEDPTLPRKKRLELKERVLAQPGQIWFYYLRKNYGIGTAIICTLHDYIKILVGK